MRRVLTLLLTVAMMLSLVVVASADTAVKLCIEPEEGDASGGTVAFKVYLDPQGTKQIGAFQFSLTATNGTIVGVGVKNRELMYVDDWDPEDGVKNGYFEYYNGEVDPDGQYNFVAAGTTDERVWMATEKTLIVTITVQMNDGAKGCKLNVVTTGDKRFSVGAKDDNGTVSEAYTSAVDSKNYGESDVLPGDVTGDGKVKMNDVMKIFDYIMGNVEFTSEQIAAADVSGDNKIKMNDVMIVFDYIMGNIESLG